MYTSCRFTSEEKAKRPSTVYMPFGVGQRNCVGARFAMLEMKMMFIQILRKVKFVQAPDTQVKNKTRLFILKVNSAIAINQFFHVHIGPAEGFL